MTRDGVIFLGRLLLWRRMANTENRGYGDTWMVGRDGWVDGGLYSALYMLYVMLSIKHVYNALVYRIVKTDAIYDCNTTTGLKCTLYGYCQS